MCGIAGELRFSSEASGADWAAISALMARRGPDDEGHWSNHQCTLVFRRLSILDLSAAGHQPIVSNDGRYVLVFNGEVYNFAELRAELLARGVSFRSHGDSEVVLYSLVEWGTGALDRFNGMFALGFYDIEQRCLLLARDHAGIKPLYVMSTGNGVVFASQYDQLLAHPWSRGLSVSREALGLYLRLAHIPAPYALLENTEMLEPGTWISVDSNSRTQRGRYFSFPQFETPVFEGAEALEAVDSAVSNAVKRQLVSDVPVASFLSGGIDSPLVTAKMQRACPEQIEAFTIGTDGDPTDESIDAAVYAEQLNVTHTLAQATPDGALGLLSDVIDACGEPMGDYSIFPTMMVSQLASQRYKVILSGDGGDELFWGYFGRSARLLRESLRLQQPLKRLRSNAKRVLGVGGVDERLRSRSLGHCQRTLHMHLAESALTDVFPALPAWPVSYGAFDFTGWNVDRTAQWLRWNEFVCHLPMVLQKVDRASMYHSLEVRVPLLDREVIDVAARVNWQTCIDLDQRLGKLPLRHSLSRHVKHQTSGKKGFSPPMDEWLKTALRPVFEESVLAKGEILGQPVDRQALRSLFDAHLCGKRNLGWGLWPLVSLALWSERYFDKRLSADSGRAAIGAS
ncbi:MAG: asparagine synthase (glutamine-hydrolyzing) [Gammaproteobacteria bacterium]